ncbi:MAG TPA: hypothetical protein VLA52_07585 [Thermohalobaculum sp.]|nr:hypothetical protein [Thermohalobaculum sp.]
MKTLKLLGMAAAAAALSGCGGGGGGGGDGDAFQSFATLEAGRSHRINGQAIVANYETDPSSGDVSGSDVEQHSAAVVITLDDIGALLAAELFVDDSGFGGNATPDLTFDTADGDIFADGDTLDPLTVDYATAISAGADRIAVAADPAAMGFEYQTFGIWATGIDTGNGTAGAGTFGFATPRQSLPANGSATYNGQSAGLFLDKDGDTFAVFADFDAFFNFTNHEISVNTTGSQAIDTATGISSAMPGLDFTGTGTVSNGGPFGGSDPDGTFEATITATDLAGTMDGRLYGPNFEEIGATFGMSGDAGQYLGAIGAVR